MGIEPNDMQRLSSAIARRGWRMALQGHEFRYALIGKMLPSS